MRQAITVKFIAGTNKTNPRYRASAAGGFVYFNQNDSYSINENRRASAIKLAKKMGWTGRFHGGVLKSGEAVYVCLDSKDDIAEFILE
jgi:hypothetical protein